MTRYRLALAALLLAALAVAAPFDVAQGRPLAQAQPERVPTAEASHGENAEAAGGSWAPVIAKAVNFSILAGALVYFLRVPMMGYLNGRIGRVREDLVTAAETRDTAIQQLAAIEAKLAALPAEIEALKKRGAEDLAAERARIEEEAQAERQRLLEHTRREIEMRLRVAKRELLELAATLAVNVASERIRTSITPDDQARLVDRYASQLPGGRQ
jgi:F-type H+-transporting ATPase subunit b